MSLLAKFIGGVGPATECPFAEVGASCGANGVVDQLRDLADAQRDLGDAAKRAGDRLASHAEAVASTRSRARRLGRIPWPLW